MFEGEITSVKLKELKAETERIMKDDDSVIIFKSREERWLEKEIVGQEPNPLDTFL